MSNVKGIVVEVAWWIFVGCVIFMMFVFLSGQARAEIRHLGNNVSVAKENTRRIYYLDQKLEEERMMMEYRREKELKEKSRAVTEALDNEGLRKRVAELEAQEEVIVKTWYSEGE